MKKKVGDIDRKGKEVYRAASSKGDKFYSIWEDNGRLTCECMGFIIRGKCRHLTEYLERQAKHKANGLYNNNFSGKEGA